MATALCTAHLDFVFYVLFVAAFHLLVFIHVKFVDLVVISLTVFFLFLREILLHPFFKVTLLSAALVDVCSYEPLGCKQAPVKLKM